MTRWALVPEDVTDDMLDAGIEAKDSGEGCVYVFGAMIAASPGYALLSEILAARDAINSTDNHRIQAYQTKRLLEALAKLGPAP